MQLFPQSLLDFADVLPPAGEVGFDVAQFLLGGFLFFFRALGVVAGVHVELLGVFDEHFCSFLWCSDFMYFSSVFPGNYF